MFKSGAWSPISVFFEHFELVSSTLQTVVKKLVYSPTHFI